MNEEEYKQWRADAFLALQARHGANAAKRVVEWFDNIKGSAEYELIGYDIFIKISEITGCVVAEGKWNLYENMMMRMWLYAPYIIAEEE